MKKSVALIAAVSVVGLISCGGGAASEDQVALGASFDLKGSQMTANYMLDGWEHPSNPFDAPFEGNKAIVLNVTVAAGEEDFSELSTNFSLGFGSEVVESTNYVGITDDSGLNVCGASVEATAGDETTCDLVFEVPSDADVSAPQLVYEALFGDEAAMTFELK